MLIKTKGSPKSGSGSGGARPGAGRKPGAISKANAKLASIPIPRTAPLGSDIFADIEVSGCRPFYELSQAIRGEMKCSVCDGSGIASYLRKSKETQQMERKERMCVSCSGTGRERISPDARIRACMHLTEFVRAKLKSIEINVSGSISLVAIARERQAQLRGTAVIDVQPG